MIKVERTDYEAANYICHTESTFIPQHYVCKYFYKNIEIAKYDSSKNIIWLNINCLSNSKTSIYHKALNGEYGNGYAQVFKMLNADRSSAFSKYNPINCPI